MGCEGGDASGVSRNYEMTIVGDIANQLQMYYLCTNRE